LPRRIRNVHEEMDVRNKPDAAFDQRVEKAGILPEVVDGDSARVDTEGTKQHEANRDDDWERSFQGRRRPQKVQREREERWESRTSLHVSPPGPPGCRDDPGFNCRGSRRRSYPHAEKRRQKDHGVIAGRGDSYLNTRKPELRKAQSANLRAVGTR